MDRDRGRIKVLRVIPQLHVAGTSNGLKWVVERLDPARFEVQVCGLFWWGEVGEQLKASGIDVVFLNARPHPYGLTAIRPLVSVMREFQPDIVHTHLDAGNTAGTIAARLACVPILITNQQNAKPGRGRLVRLMEYFLAPLSARIVTISYRAAELHAAQVTNSLKKWHPIDHNWPNSSSQPSANADPHLQYRGRLSEISKSRIPPEKYYVIYAVAPVDEFPFRKEKTSCDFLGVDGDPIIGNVARLTGQKGQIYLLRAFRRVLQHYPTARLLMVGEGPLREQLQRETQRLGLSERVTCTGKRPDVLQVLQCLDVFVMPSLWEGCGTAALEAMAVGVPIVASAVGGLSESIVPDVTGLLVSPAQPEHLAKAILNVLCQPDAALERARAARWRMEAHFSAEAAATRTTALYEELVAANGGDRCTRTLL